MHVGGRNPSRTMGKPWLRPLSVAIYRGIKSSTETHPPTPHSPPPVPVRNGCPQQLIALGDQNRLAPRAGAFGAGRLRAATQRPRWFGAAVGGDMVWSFRPGEAPTPPRTETPRSASSRSGRSGRSGGWSMVEFRFLFCFCFFFRR